MNAGNIRNVKYVNSSYIDSPGETGLSKHCC